MSTSSPTTYSPTIQPVPAIPFFAISLVWIAGIFLIVIFCFWAHKTKYVAKYHHDTIEHLREMFLKAKDPKADIETRRTLPEIHKKLREVTENSSVYIDMYEGVMDPLANNSVMKSVDHAVFHNPVGRTCVVAGSKMIDQVVNSLAFAFGGIISATGVFFAQKYTDYENEAMVVALLSIGALFFGALMLQAAQHQCFQDKMNGDYGMFEKES